MNRRAALLVPALSLALGVGAVGVGHAAAVRFAIQPDASELIFKATSRIVNATGRFHRFAGEVLVEPGDLTTAQVSLTLEATSLDTGITRRDNHLRSEDFFDVARFPTATFESLAVAVSQGTLSVVGRLTLHGVAREIQVPLDVQITGDTLVARGEFRLNRHDYGISYQSRLNPIGDTVVVAFTLRGVAAARSTRP